MGAEAGDTAQGRLGFLRPGRRGVSGRRIQAVGAVVLVVLGPVLAIATFLVLGPLDVGASDLELRLVLLFDLVYVLSVATLVFHRIVKIIAARRAQSAGSRLHLRLTAVFSLVALVPTVLVAVFAGLTLNVGLEGWFSDRVRDVVGASLEAAEAYEAEHRRDLSTDAQAVALLLDRQNDTTRLMTDGDLRLSLAQVQGQIQRGLKEAYVIDGAGEIRARGERSYLFGYEAPDPFYLAEAREGETVIIADWDNNEFRALIRLDSFVDRYLYVSRTVDGQLLSLLDETQQSAVLYQQLEQRRGQLLFDFGLLYLGFAVILILAAIWLGLWLAERISRPVGRLAGAAQSVGGGDLDVQVREEKGDDEIAMLGRIFNQMTRQLKRQRESLLEANRTSEERRRLFDSVLGSITSGVMAVDAEGQVELVNRSGARLLALDDHEVSGEKLVDLVPDFAELLDSLRQGPAEDSQHEITMHRGGVDSRILVRLAIRRARDGRVEGFVIAFDDVTDLVTAQRMAAWGDVARRIAHEIKNPLTPIQLSAGRIKRKFGKHLDPEQAEALERLTDVIVRQTEDLRRIVDEFSRFARMPQPDQSQQDLTALIRDAVLLQEADRTHVEVLAELPDEALMAEIDTTLMSQALTNLIKNAVEAATEHPHPPDGHRPEVRVALKAVADGLEISVSDNGPGFPPDRSRLFEPYVTTREKGTGLGLPIVMKIVEDHGGRIALEDAAAFAPGAAAGAKVVIWLPVEAGQSNAQAAE
ncbi:MAG: PAS domain-containing sensor histidine kinase [Rhodobacteraceae bacterium]|nr:PAS domain-containing sensor histidine kinase [Paracoccaceae bacterium]